MVSKVERYQQILNAARSILAEKGFDEAKVIEVVEKAGVAKGTFYIYFPSKLDLVIALAREMREKILYESQKLMDVNDNQLEKLIQVIQTAFYVMEQYNDVFPVFNAVSAFKTEHWKSEKEIREPYFNFLRELIEKGQKSGDFNTDLDVEKISSLIEGMVEHVAHECLVYHSHFQVTDYLSTIRQLLQNTLCNSQSA